MPYQGDLGGIAGADAKCQRRANAAGLGGTYAAWISTATDYPANRFMQSTEPYIQVDGSQIAANWTALTSGTLETPFNFTELGEPVNYRAWTDTKTDGTPQRYDGNDDNNNCRGWSTIDHLTIGYYGQRDRTDRYWTEGDFQANNQFCSDSVRLYCFGQG